MEYGAGVFSSMLGAVWSAGVIDAGAGEFMPGAKRLKVLVVDDARELADLTVELIRFHGVDALGAYSGEEALRVLEEDREITAVFSDVMMPGMTGLDLARIVANCYPQMCIVLASAYKFQGVGEDNLGYPFLTKPYRIDTVLSLLRECGRPD